MTEDLPGRRRQRRPGPWSCTADLGDRARPGSRPHRDRPPWAQVADDYPAAAAALRQALELYRGLGHRGGEAEALNELGTVHRS